MFLIFSVTGIYFFSVFSQFLFGFLPDLNNREQRESKGSSFIPRMEGSEGESMSKGSDQGDRSNSPLNTEEEQQVCHNDQEEAEKCCQAHGTSQALNEVKTDTDIQTDTEMEVQTCSQEQARDELHTDVISDDAFSTEGEKPSLSIQTGTASTTPVDEVVESSPSSLEGTLATLLTFNDMKDSCDIYPNADEHLFDLAADCTAAAPPHEDSASTVSPSSVQCCSEHSPTDSTTTSGISNGPSTPSSDTVGSSPASSPQTSANTPAPLNSLSSPYDTDCSRKLISQIQRSLSQESLLDELESELLACQLPAGVKSQTANGLAADQEGCVAVFEKCVQYKYAQQEKAIQR